MNCELTGNECNLVAYYKFNQGTAGGNNAGVTTLVGSTTNGYNGTLNNFALSGSTSNWISPGGVTTGNNCGVADTDTDNDGTPDCNDGCPNDANKTAPGTCGCGVADTDSDNDGTADCNDGCPNDPNKTAPGQCGCGVADTDTDNDGTADCNDDCPNDPNKIAPGQCGCGVADTDTDNDGTADCNDGCPNDPNKTAPGSCGCGNPDIGVLAITCPASVPVISTNSNCQGTIPDYTALGSVSGDCAASTVAQTPPQGAIVNPGTVAIKLTVTNSNSGATANCVFNVTVSGGCGN